METEIKPHNLRNITTGGSNFLLDNGKKYCSGDPGFAYSHKIQFSYNLSTTIVYYLDCLGMRVSNYTKLMKNWIGLRQLKC